MNVTLLTQRLHTMEQVRAFLDGTAPVDIAAVDRIAAYGFVGDTLKRFRYFKLPKADKGLLCQYLCRLTGFSRQHMVRLIARFRQAGVVRDRRRAPARPFVRIYTPEDIRLLADVDRLHGTLSGPATRKICERSYRMFGDDDFVRLAGISNGHIYNLRQCGTYRKERVVQEKTRPNRSPIGERRKPAPDGKPGYLRVDSVHQGDLDGIKGLYLINLVDETTQMQCVCAVEKISERFLLPVLEKALASFPFIVLGFHSDNGSEYVNHRIASLLEKLRIEFTKSRARRCNDNALVESKNGSTVRRHLGYAHIPSRFAHQVNAFTTQVLTPYLNFHRPCFFPETYIDSKGRQRKRYRYDAMMTPCEKLLSLPGIEHHLKPGITLAALDEQARQISDNDAARHLCEARARLFQTINKARSTAA